MTALENKRKQLLYKSTHRGTKENDILLGRFAEKTLQNMGQDELSLYEEFLNIQDQILFEWITGQVEPEFKYKDLVNVINKV